MSPSRDFSDAPTGETARDELDDAAIPELGADHERRVHDVASRLGAIGDSLLLRREGESGSELEGHSVGAVSGLRRRSS